MYKLQGRKTKTRNNPVIPSELNYYKTTPVLTLFNSLLERKSWLQLTFCRCHVEIWIQCGNMVKQMLRIAHHARTCGSVWKLFLCLVTQQTIKASLPSILKIFRFIQLTCMTYCTHAFMYIRCFKLPLAFAGFKRLAGREHSRSLTQL